VFGYCTRMNGRGTIGVLIAVSILLVLGIVSAPAFSVAGAALYVVWCVFRLWFVYQVARAHARDPDCAEQMLSNCGDRKPVDFLEGMIVFIVLGSLAFGAMGAGLIVWIAVIVKAVASGIILRDVGGIPLELRYGEWRGARLKRRR
jgi:cobalamin synthase